LFRMESTPFVFLNSPAYADVVLVEQPDNFEKPTLLRASLGLLNNGLLTSKNAPNRQHRKLIAPAFTPRHIAAYAGIIADYAEQIPRRWAKDGAIEAEREMLHLILQILGKTLFDVELEDERHDFSKALAAVQRWIDDRRNARLKPPLSWPISSNKRFFEARAQLDAAIYHMIQERRQSGQERSDMLSMLVHARDEQGYAMPDVQVRDEVITMILAGQETLASAIAWAWYLLTKHPEIYAHMQREVAHASSGRAVTFTDLPS
jgi:cytochrome P450